MEPKVPKNIFSPQIKLEDIDVVEIARQITLIDFSLFSQITLGDILSKEWREQEKIPQKISNMIERSNSFSNWVVSSLLSIVETSERALKYLFFINLLSELYKINNFFASFSLFSALVSTPILRLKNTLKLIPEEQSKVFYILFIIFYFLIHSNFFFFFLINF